VDHRHPGTPGVSCAMALRLTSRSSRRRIPVCHRHRTDERFAETRLGPPNLRRLDISNGCQNHTTSPYAATFLHASPGGRVRPAGMWRRRFNVVRLRALFSLTENPPCDDPARRRCRVHRIPCPTSVTIAIRPSGGLETAGVMPVIWGMCEAECFFGGDWTGGIALKLRRKFRYARSVPSPYIEHCKQLSLADRQHGHISRRLYTYHHTALDVEDAGQGGARIQSPTLRSRE
jgi:hypothetical protein